MDLDGADGYLDLKMLSNVDGAKGHLDGARCYLDGATRNISGFWAWPAAEAPVVLALTLPVSVKKKQKYRSS